MKRPLTHGEGTSLSPRARQGWTATSRSTLGLMHRLTTNSSLSNREDHQLA